MFKAERMDKQHVGYLHCFLMDPEINLNWNTKQHLL